MRKAEVEIKKEKKKRHNNGKRFNRNRRKRMKETVKQNGSIAKILFLSTSELKHREVYLKKKK